jgi:nitric oxide dioxygenase
MTADAASIDAELQLWLESPQPGNTAPGTNEGFMSLREVDLPADASLYLCGPLPFMKKIRDEAIDAGIPSTRIHYEVFGPDVWQAN